MTEFHELTPANTFNHRERIWQNKALFEVSIFDGAFRLSSIRIMERQKGNGTAALIWLCTLADKHGVTMTGDAVSTGPKNVPYLTKRQLKAWYARHGFTVGRRGQLSYGRKE